MTSFVLVSVGICLKLCALIRLHILHDTLLADDDTTLCPDASTPTSIEGDGVINPAMGSKTGGLDDSSSGTPNASPSLLLPLLSLSSVFLLVLVLVRLIVGRSVGGCVVSWFTE